MPTPTYTPLANITLGSSAASVTFSSISQAYRDLVLVISVKVDTGSDGPYLRFNADSGTNYPIVTMDGNGTTATSATFTSYTALAIANNAYVNATTFTQYNTNIMDYSATDKHKSVLSRGNNAALATEAIAGRWANTAAITSIGVVLGGARNWAAGSTFALYGISA